jgi:hypothetical protein
LAIHPLDLIIGLVTEFGAIREGNCDKLRFVTHDSPFAHEKRILVAVTDAEVSAWSQTLTDDRVEAICIRDREWPPEETIDEAETGDGQTHSERQRKNRGGRGNFVFSELPQTEDGVSAEGIEPGYESSVATCFTMAKGRAEGAACFIWIASSGDGFRNVRFKFLVDFAMQPFIVKRVSQPGPD